MFLSSILRCAPADSSGACKRLLRATISGSTRPCRWMRPVHSALIFELQGHLLEG